jgi:hypothetical protein
MAENVAINIPMVMPPEQTLTQATFPKGVITLINESNLPLDALKEAKNIFLYEKGAPGPRWGTNWYGAALPGLPIPGAPALALAAGTNLGIGVYIYVVTFVTLTGETTAGTSATITTTGSNQAVNLTAIPVGVTGSVTARKIYRTAVGGAVGTAKLVTTIADNTTTVYSDTLVDGSLGAAVPTTNTATAAIDGGGMYQSASKANHLVAESNGYIYRSLDNGATWTICTGANFTAGKKCYHTQAAQSGGGNNYMYITNGYDYPVRYDGTTTLVPFVAITPPTSPTAVQTGLAGSVYTYYYRISAVNAVGTTQGTVTASVNVSSVRGAWDPTHTGSKYVTLSWTATTGAVRYDIYIADNASDDAASNHYYLDSVGAVTPPSYIDAGQQVVNPNATVPLTNTTGAPRVRELVPVGSRLYGVQDRDFPYRVWFTGSGPFIGYFSDSYDGGYIDLQRGSQYFPVQVADYRDGKGTPLATIWCDSADTRGCVWQMTLTATTILNTQFTQPSANKLPGSRGTGAPNSVVNILNDYSFFNYQAQYNLGSRAQFLNLLSTDESTANIRTTLTTNINPANIAGVCSFYFQAKQFTSYPSNSTVNNTTMVYDTERKAYLPEAYTLGMERLFQYTDITGSNHLMFWKPGDNQFSETSSGIKGDYGVAFRTSLTTGLIPTQKDRFGFMYVNQAYIEFAQQVSSIYIELIGIDRTRGYGTQKSVTMPGASAIANNVGWSTFAWSTTPWDFSGTPPIIYSESSKKRYFVVNRELNAFQWHVTTQDLLSAYFLRTLQLSGSPTNAGMPRQWRLTPV